MGSHLRCNTLCRKIKIPSARVKLYRKLLGNFKRVFLRTKAKREAKLFVNIPLSGGGT